ncbi:MAG: chorismate-binding protein [Planctomycetes bacterium]|nr:chorismate-binding protein [Planctomycetota bacterium]
MRDFLKTGGFVGHRPGRVLVFHGPLVRTAAPPADRPALYAPDFFLEDRFPWHVPERCEDLPIDALFDRLPAAEPAATPLEWTAPDRHQFAARFADLKRRIDAGELVKGVPVAFSTARAEDPRAPWLARLLRGALRAAPDAVPYGLWDAAGGVVGATPEVLLDLAPDGSVRSMALAGTADPDQAGEELLAPKERAEHRIVVDDVVGALARFGAVTCGPARVVALQHLAHLRTEIALEPTRPVSFAELVRALHPTAALGGSPRAHSAAWLREMDRTQARGRFGAPFGVRAPDGSGRAVVAIRCVAWAGSTLRLGAGAGIVADSRLEAEWAEILRKVKAIRRTLLA